MASSITSLLKATTPLKSFERHRQLHSQLKLIPMLSLNDWPAGRLVQSRPRRFLPSALPPSENEPLLVEASFENRWSFLEDLDTRNADRIIAAGAIKDGSRILISVAPEDFVDRVMETTSSEVIVAHQSLFALACIKEKYDNVKCWQGKLTRVPAKWAPLDAVFLYFLPALEEDIHNVLGAFSGICREGTRVVVSHPQGRSALKQNREMVEDFVLADLPEADTLQSLAAAHNFDVIEFVDDDGVFLAVLSFLGL